MQNNPWEVHPELTEERLGIVGKIISRTRKEALELYEPEKGDGPWSLECRIYERTMNGFLSAADQFFWLRCIRNNLYFVVLVGGVPFRFKRKDFERASEMDIRLLHPEIMAHQLAFEFHQSDWHWRLFIETDEYRDVLRLVLAQITESGNTRNAYTIKISDTVSIAAPAKPSLREAATLEKVKLGVKNQSENKAVTHGNN